MTQSVVAAGAVYIPDCALNTRGGQRRVCAADEDAVTLAVEAGSRVLGHQPVGLPAIETLVVALGDHQGGLDSGVAAQVVREALGLASAVRVMTVSGEDVLGGLAALQAGRDS